MTIESNHTTIIIDGGLLDILIGSKNGEWVLQQLSETSKVLVLVNNQQRNVFYWLVKPRVVLVLFSSFPSNWHDWFYFCSSLVSENE